jgi:hypothetical protein
MSRPALPENTLILHVKPQRGINKLYKTINRSCKSLAPIFYPRRMSSACMQYLVGTSVPNRYAYITMLFPAHMEKISADLTKHHL